MGAGCSQRGHAYHGGLVRAVAQALRKNAREGVHASRYGGDEFVCLCVNLTDAEMEAYIQRVMGSLAQEHVPHEKHLNSDILTVSLGYCNEVFAPDVDMEKLLDLADQALFSVKASLRGGYARKRAPTKAKG